MLWYGLSLPAVLFPWVLYGLCYIPEFRPRTLFERVSIEPELAHIKRRYGKHGLHHDLAYPPILVHLAF